MLCSLGSRGPKSGITPSSSNTGGTRGSGSTGGACKWPGQTVCVAAANLPHPGTRQPSAPTAARDQWAGHTSIPCARNCGHARPAAVRAAHRAAPRAANKCAAQSANPGTTASLQGPPPFLGWRVPPQAVSTGGVAGGEPSRAPIGGEARPLSGDAGLPGVREGPVHGLARFWEPALDSLTSSRTPLPPGTPSLPSSRTLSFLASPG
jgi:hypothetical protein